MTIGQRARVWWEEYYSDNPVQRLAFPDLYRTIVSSQPKPYMPVMKPEKARRIAYWCWGIALFSLLMLYLAPLSRAVLQQIQASMTGQTYLVGVCLLIFTLGALSQAGVLGKLFSREHESKTWTFLIITRLKGTHLVYGRVLPALVLGAVLFIGVYCAPFILFIMVCCYGWLEGIARTLQALWMIMTSYCFLVALGTRVIVSVRSLTAARVRLGLLWFIIYAGFFFLMSYLSANGIADYVRWLRDNPSTAFDPRTWGLSLLPVLFLTSSFAVSSLFWGIPQGVAYLLLAWRLCEWSGETLEKMRRLPEPVRRQEEGT